MNSVDIAIVGGGVAAHTQAYYLRRAAPGLNILLIVDESGSPSCSLRSTGIVSAFAMQDVPTPGAKRIVTAYQKTEKFFEHSNPRGVVPAKHIFPEKITHQAYLVQPEVYLDWLAESGDYKVVRDRVSKVRVGEGVVHTVKGGIVKARVIILAAGAYLKRDGEVFPGHPEFSESAIVAGSCITFPAPNQRGDSFIISTGGGGKPRTNLIYRSFDKKLVVGSASDRQELESLYKETTKCSNYSNYLTDPPPPFEEGEIREGLRHRGRKRRPFWGEIAPGMYLTCGLYKNGWTLATLAAEQLTEQILGDCKIL